MTSKKYQELLQCSKRIAEIFYQDVCAQEYPLAIWEQSSQQFALKSKNTLPLLWGNGTEITIPTPPNPQFWESRGSRINTIQLTIENFLNTEVRRGLTQRSADLCFILCVPLRFTRRSSALKNYLVKRTN